MSSALRRIQDTVFLCLSLLALAILFSAPAKAQGELTYFGDGPYRIMVVANGRVVHADGGGDRLISTRYQVLDEYSSFYIATTGDGVSEIYVRATDRHWHVDGNGDRLVSTRYQPHDAFTRFRIYKMSDRLGGYRIQVVATGRYLHEDGLNDRLLSTRYQVDDAFSRFRIVRHDP